MRGFSEEDLMRVIANSDLCEANAVCVRSCPEVFRLEIPEALRSGVERAVRGCPRQALSLQE